MDTWSPNKNDTAMKSEITAEPLPLESRNGSMVSLIQSIPELSKKFSGPDEMMDIQLSDGDELTEQLKIILHERIQAGNTKSLFQLGQLYFETDNYKKALEYFIEAATHGDIQAIFQLGVMYYDGLGCSVDHKKGVEYMMQVSNSGLTPYNLVKVSQYNIGRAYFQGFGVNHSDEEAVRYWLLAADDGNPNASIKAQTMLGLFYCRTESLNLKCAFFWHSEACGNGSLESQEESGREPNPLHPYAESPDYVRNGGWYSESVNWKQFKIFRP